MSLPDILLPKITFFGLSIERLVIHGIELNEKGSVIRQASVPLPEDTFSDGILKKADSFVSALQSLMASGKFTTVYAAVTFPEVFAYTRGFSLPLVASEDIDEAVGWHAKSLFPFPPEDIYFDWRLMEKTAKDYQLTAVAVQKKVLDPLLDCLAKAGIKPLRFEPDVSALARLLTLNPGKYALLVEVNQLGSYITLVDNEKAIFTTVVPFVQGDTPASYLLTINQTISEIAAYYEKKGLLSAETATLYITGTLASEEWVKHVSQLVRYPVKLLQTTMPSPSLNKAFAAAKLKITPPSDPSSINLLPTNTQLVHDTQRTMAFYDALVLRAIMVVGVFAFVAALFFGMFTYEKQQLDVQLKTLRKTNDEKRTNTQRLLALNAQSKLVVSLAPLRKTPKEKIAMLRDLAPEGISITGWEYDDAKLEFKLNGTAKTREIFLLWRERIETSTAFGKVVIPLGALESAVNVPFSITFLTKN